MPPKSGPRARQIAALWLSRLPLEIWHERMTTVAGPEQSGTNESELEQPKAAPAQVAIVIDDSVTKKRPFTPRGVTRLADASDDLRARGVAPPMRTLDAQRYAPALQIEIVVDVDVEARLETLAELLLRVTPVVEPGRALGPHQNAIFLDFTGLVGEVETHAARAREILAAQGHSAIIAIAPGKRLALALARDPRAPALRVVTAANREEALRTLPLGALGLDFDLVDTLRELGLKTAGALAKMRRANLAPRLHDEAKATLALIAGHDAQPLSGIAPPEEISEKVTLDFGVQTIEPLLFLVRPLADRVIARLLARQERLGQIVVRLRLQRPRTEAQPFVDVTTTLVFPEPVDQANAVVQAFAARLGRHGIVDEAGQKVPHPEVVGLALIVTRAGRRVAVQQDAFSLRGAPPAALRALLGELWAELGGGAAGRLHLFNSRLPERMTELRWEEDARSSMGDRTPLQEARDLSAHGCFMAGWPWPLKLWQTPCLLETLEDAGTLIEQRPLALIEGEAVALGEGRPFRRAYDVLIFADGRRALGFEDEELEQIWVQGWFD